MGLSIGAAIGGAIGGGLLGGASSARGARKKYKRDMHMYKNRHLWEVQDLKRAGLNPILSAGGSPGTPAAQAAPGQSVGSDAIAGANTALAEKRQEVELEQMGTMIEKNIQDRNIGEATQRLINQQEKNAGEQQKILRGDAAEAYWKEKLYSTGAGAPLTTGKAISRSLPNVGLGAIFRGKSGRDLYGKENKTLRKRLKARQRIQQNRKKRRNK